MQIIKDIKALREILTSARLQNKSIGFVPTMGALHEGHLSLIRRSKKENDLTVLSIFVNPMQFGPREDYRTYPRDKKNDCLFAKKEKVDIIFSPSVYEIYPLGYLTYINVEKIADILCGKSRPGHFQGVTTIVGKLLNIVQPQVLYLGQKDAQQCVVLKQMVRDLNFPVTVKILPTMREADGLAMSSRNQYLTRQGRQEATYLYKALKLAKTKILKGERHPTTIIKLMQSLIDKNTSGKIDYIACVDSATLAPLKILKGEILIALAVYFGKARLIDNMLVRV